MPDIQTAVTSVPVSNKGRKPVLLKGGKPLAQARTEAKQAHAAAKAELRTAINTHKDAQKAERAAAKSLAVADTALARVIAKPSPDKGVQREALAIAKNDQKAAVKMHKAAAKNTAASAKQVEKATAAVAKADAARLKVEEANLAAKAPAIKPTLN